MSQNKISNKLVDSTSPYLKQHAYNPVQWHPWGEEALMKAVEEDKPMIISIGYSACHWCHVMERESFENEEIAKVMNDGFICIKVDREERPDVDQVYMEAVQTMGLQGGWPLNVFTMPDQKPFYGGTYFQPKQWVHILKSIREAYDEKRGELVDSAEAFAKSLAVTDSEKYGFKNHDFQADTDTLKNMANAMKNHLDHQHGGLKRAPKFPNPSIWKFLLTANYYLKDTEIHDHLMLTLTKMGNGGIYDQIGGGFARYSVDERWFAPHFEKMLYDNAQLISLYANGFQVSQNVRFKEVVYESIDFIKRELTSPDYGFYCALDADSEGEEGNYYIWSEAELNEVLGKESKSFKKYYQVTPSGNWERGLNILHISQTPEQFASENGLEKASFIHELSLAKSKLMEIRAKREKPGLDDKILTSWNALMLKGLVDAYHAFGEKAFLELADKNASFIHENLYRDGALIRSFAQKGTEIHGYLDDYAFVIEAFIALYQANFERKWLDLATELTEYSLEHFYDEDEGLFFYTSNTSEQLVARKKEIFDNVIPASNSAMAQNLFLLGNVLERTDFIEISEGMLAKVIPLMKNDPQYLTNWGTLYSLRTKPTAEIAIVGEEYQPFAHGFQRHFMPNKIIVADRQSGDLPLLQNREPVHGKTTVYVCYNKACNLPAHTVEEAMEQLTPTTKSSKS